MWLIGAGASAAGGIPTATDMIWDFKQRLYVSQRRAEPHSVADLSNTAVRARLQAHVDASGRFPCAGAPDEYAALFEAVYPVETDRRSYLDARIAGSSASYGHIALATLMRAGHARLFWTTNFDPLLADAAARVFGSTGALGTVSLDAPDVASQLISEERWPVEIKLHGDFRSRRLKNTSDELRHQDTLLRRLLVDCCRRYGLVVVGYSGRDDSVMGALEEAAGDSPSFPRGLFWLHRDAPLRPRVEKLLEQATKQGVETGRVVVENFDEALRDLLRLFEGLDTAVLDEFATARRRWSGAPLPIGRRGWPAVRVNALPVATAPTVCRRIACSIGGYAEIQGAISSAGVNVICARVRAGVLAFGEDADLHAVFDRYDIGEFDLHTIELRRLRYDSGERGLLRDALARALARNRNLAHKRRRSSDLLYPADRNDVVWQPLRDLVGDLSGTVPGHPALEWAEGVGTRLDWADDRLWLLIEPRSVFAGIDDQNQAAAAEFARERTVRRYNRQLNDLVAFWANLLAGRGEALQALEVTDGVAASFALAPETAFSRRFLG
jgi:hypothetical protein